MFFAVVEKQNSGFIDGWSTRYIALDTNRRHLYYSEAIKNPLSLSPPVKYTQEGLLFELHGSSASPLSVAESSPTTAQEPSATGTTPSLPFSTHRSAPIRSSSIRRSHQDHPAAEEPNPAVRRSSVGASTSQNPRRTTVDSAPQAEDGSIPLSLHIPATSSTSSSFSSSNSLRSRQEAEKRTDKNPPHPLELLDAPPQVLAAWGTPNASASPPPGPPLVHLERKETAVLSGSSTAVRDSLSAEKEEGKKHLIGSPAPLHFESSIPLVKFQEVEEEGGEEEEEEEDGEEEEEKTVREVEITTSQFPLPMRKKQKKKRKTVAHSTTKRRHSIDTPPVGMRNGGGLTPSTAVKGKANRSLSLSSFSSPHPLGTTSSTLPRRRHSEDAVGALPPPARFSASGSVAGAPFMGADSTASLSFPPSLTPSMTNGLGGSVRHTDHHGISTHGSASSASESLNRSLVRRSSTKVFQTVGGTPAKVQVKPAGGASAAIPPALSEDSWKGTPSPPPPPATVGRPAPLHSLRPPPISPSSLSSLLFPPPSPSVSPEENPHGVTTTDQAVPAETESVPSIPSFLPAFSSTSPSLTRGSGDVKDVDHTTPRLTTTTTTTATKTPEASHSRWTSIFGSGPSASHRPPPSLPSPTSRESRGRKEGGGGGGGVSPSPPVLHTPSSPSDDLASSTTASSPSSTHKALQGVKWKGKVKISSLGIAARQRTIVSPSQLYLLDITGVVRELAVGEAPCDYLLCPSTKLDQVPNFSPTHRRWMQRDPYHISELYSSLRDQCLNRKRQRELAIAKRKREEGLSYRPSEDEKGPVYGTIRSPVKKNEFLAFNAEKLLTFRFTSEYHYVRFVFVLTSVMGYDQKGPRPYGGYPPVDPRNKLLFASLPPTAAYDLAKVESRLPYIYCHGNCLGRDADGKLQISLKNCFLCITNEMVMPVRGSGTIPVWLAQCHIIECYYNYKATRPYIALISDPGECDIIFSPSLPELGMYLPGFPFSPSMQVQRLIYILHQCCFANSEVRRVITFTEIKETTIHGFVDRVERERQRELELRLRVPHGRSPICPEGNVNIRGLYSTVQAHSAEIDRHVVENAAVPLYDTNPNNTPISAEHLQLMRSLVEKTQLEGELVGLALESVTSLALACHHTAPGTSGEDEGVTGVTPMVETSTEELRRSVLAPSSTESGRRRGGGGVGQGLCSTSLSAMGLSGRKSSADVQGGRGEEEPPPSVRGSILTHPNVFSSQGGGGGRGEGERDRLSFAARRGSSVTSSLSDAERWGREGKENSSFSSGVHRPALATSLPEEVGFMFASATARRRHRRLVPSHSQAGGEGSGALQDRPDDDPFLRSQGERALSASHPPLPSRGRFSESASHLPPRPWRGSSASLPSPSDGTSPLPSAAVAPERNEDAMASVTDGRRARDRTTGNDEGEERRQWCHRSVGDEVLREGSAVLSLDDTVDSVEEAATGAEEVRRTALRELDHEEDGEEEEEEEYDEEDHYVYGQPGARYLSRDSIDIFPSPDASSLLLTIPHENTSRAEESEAAGSDGGGDSKMVIAAAPSPSSPSGERRKSKKSAKGSVTSHSFFRSSPHGSEVRGGKLVEHGGTAPHSRAQKNVKIIGFGSTEET